MLGRKDYTNEELATATTAVDQQVAAFAAVVDAAHAAQDKTVIGALEELEPVLFNGLLLTLDRYFVHRLRVTAGKDNNPVNEVELVADSLINNGGVFRTGNVVKYAADQSVLHLRPGDHVRLTADDFERLSSAFLAELDRRFVSA